jgi:hypothetical protein
LMTDVGMAPEHFYRKIMDPVPVVT